MTRNVITIFYDRNSVKQRQARELDFTGRSMRGFVAAAAADLRADSKLKEWLEWGLRYARSLAPKPRKRTLLGGTTTR